VSLPLFLWMTPVIVGLLLSIPVAMLSARALQVGQRAGLFGTPEQNAPPRVLSRANELALVAPGYGASPLHELWQDAELREAHVKALAEVPRRRGQVDAHLAIARAKIDEAENFDEAVSYLNPKETFAALNSRIALQQLDELRQRTSVA
jgi:membrane glycosyltransferase